MCLLFFPSIIFGHRLGLYRLELDTRSQRAGQGIDDRIPNV